MKRATQRKRNFHVPLSEELYAQLQREARRSGHPATEIARAAIRHALSLRAKKELYRELHEYALRHGGTSVDLDQELEAAGIESLLRNVPA